MEELSHYFGALPEGFSTIAVTAAGVVFLSGWVNTHLFKLKGTYAQALTWVVAIGLSVFGKLAGYGMFAHLSYFSTVLNALGIGLVANGLYSFQAVQKMMIAVRAKAPNL